MKKILKRIRLVLVFVFIILLYYFAANTTFIQQSLANPEALKEIILRFGILAPIAVIILQAFQTTISIIPSQLTTIVAGFIFGPYLGLLYSLIGAFLGSALVFYISRKFGKNIALHFFEKRELIHFNMLFKQKRLWALFLARIAPLFPNDLVSFAAGLTTVPTIYFSIISTLGFIVQMFILTYFGSELSTGTVSIPLLIITTLVSTLFMIVIFKNRIKKIIIKDICFLEKEEDAAYKFVEKEWKGL